MDNGAGVNFQQPTYDPPTLLPDHSIAMHSLNRQTFDPPRPLDQVVQDSDIKIYRLFEDEDLSFNAPQEVKETIKEYNFSHLTWTSFFQSLFSWTNPIWAAVHEFVNTVVFALTYFIPLPYVADQVTKGILLAHQMIFPVNFHAKDNFSPRMIEFGTWTVFFIEAAIHFTFVFEAADKATTDSEIEELAYESANIFHTMAQSTFIIGNLFKAFLENRYDTKLDRQLKEVSEAARILSDLAENESLTHRDSRGKPITFPIYAIEKNKDGLVTSIEHFNLDQELLTRMKTETYLFANRTIYFDVNYLRETVLPIVKQISTSSPGVRCGDIHSFLRNRSHYSSGYIPVPTEEA